MPETETKKEVEQLTWPLAFVMVGLVLVACLFVVGMNLSTALMVSCR